MRVPDIPRPARSDRQAGGAVIGKRDATSRGTPGRIDDDVAPKRREGHEAAHGSTPWGMPSVIRGRAAG
jgi:hypothetical protein